MKRLLSPRDLAEAIGVSESSLRRWADSGSLGFIRTKGGHRRIPIGEALRFIRQTNYRILRPEKLGLQGVQPFPSADEDHPAMPPAERLFNALTAGDGSAVRGILWTLFLNENSLAGVFDGIVRPAMQRIGELWKHDDRGIYQEHRATGLCLGAIRQIQAALPEPDPRAPFCLCCAPSCDQYQVPCLMASVVLSESMMQVMNLGPELPPESLTRAIEDYRPRLVCVSVSTTGGAEALEGQMGPVLRQLAQVGGQLILGGRFAKQRLIAGHANAQRLSCMAELSAYAKGVLAAEWPRLRPAESTQGSATS